MKLNVPQHKFLLTIVTSTMLLGCSHNSPAPVFDLSDSFSASPVNSKVEVIPSQYTVMPGDTLFSIAWFHSVDYRELAKINHLKNNLIYPGQKLTIAPSRKQRFFDSDSLRLAINKEVLNKSVKTRTFSQQKNSQVPASKGKKTTVTVAKKKLDSSKRVATKSKAISGNKPAKTSKSINWIWPADGKILTRFSARSNASKGLDIDAALGQPVRATAPGQVVYEGNGLRGYGNLVIIKHSNNYLSAYAHNNKIHVSENEFVKSGQRIADVGSSGTQREKLHFEIRYKGKPVDPLNYLPEKKF